MKVSNNTVVSFHYELSEAGKAIESSRDRSPVLSLIGQGGLIVGLEKALLDKTAGETFEVSVPPEEGYGEYVERELMRVPIKHLLGSPKKVKPGQVVYVNTQQGQRSAVAVKVGKFNVDVDTNHPFAGKTLDFKIEILDVREATQEEMAHGHAHGAGGHHH